MAGGKGRKTKVTQLRGGGHGSLSAEDKQHCLWNAYCVPCSEGLHTYSLSVPMKCPQDGFIWSSWLAEDHVVGGDSLRLMPKFV